MTAVKAMLPSPVQPGDLERLLTDDSWVASVKANGDRVLGNRAGFYGRNGDKYTKRVPVELGKLVRCLPEGLTVDGELLPDGTWLLFDCVIAGAPLPHRLSTVALVVELAETMGAPVCCVDHVAGSESKVAAVAEWRAAGEEGVVFKRLDAPYVGGRTKAWLKWKNVETCDVVVTTVGVDGHDNLELSVYRDGQLVPVGRCSALTGDGPRVKVGDIVEVGTLGLSANGRLVQPVTPKLRSGDKAPAECTWDDIEVLRRHI